MDMEVLDETGFSILCDEIAEELNIKKVLSKIENDTKVKYKYQSIFEIADNDFRYATWSSEGFIEKRYQNMIKDRMIFKLKEELNNEE